MSDRYFPIPVVYINGVPQGVRRYDDGGQRMDDNQPPASRLDAPAAEPSGLSLSLKDDALGIGAMLDDGTRERERLLRILADIRKVLGEDGLHAQQHELPALIAAKIQPAVSAPEGGRPPIEFNINDSVWVKLTAHGRAHLAGKWPSYSTKIERPDGWSKWQLWHLMEAFGDALYLGCQTPFETVIRIPQPEPASPSRAALLALVEQWRTEAAPHIDAAGDEAEIAYAKAQCADQLAALLTSEPSDQAR